MLFWGAIFIYFYTLICYNEVGGEINESKYKKIVLVDLEILVASFITVCVTANAQNIVWNLSKIVFFISLFVYCISIFLVSVEAKKNKKKLTGWISVVQTITIVIIIFFIIIGISSYFSNRAYKNSVKKITQNNSNITSNLDYNNPCNIKNGEIAFRKYARGMNLILKNIKVEYLETDGKGRYAFKGDVAVSFSSTSNYSQTETWYIVIIMKGNQYTYEAGYSVDNVKFASKWGTE